MHINEIFGAIVDAAMKVLKVVEQVLGVHRAQLLSYLKLADKGLGLLINFNVVHLRDGIRRIANGLSSSMSLASSAVVGWFIFTSISPLPAPP